MRILCATSVRDEGPYLIEWLAWHRLLGASDFLIASNDCRDGTDLLLDGLARAGLIRHLPQPPMAGLARAKGKAASVQWRALKAIWAAPERKLADWMLISDVDEFPVIHRGAGRFADLITALPEGAEAVALAWRLFGASGVAEFEDRPVTAQFRRSAPPDMIHPVAATLFKSLFRPGAFQRPGVHRPQRRAEQGAAAWVDGSGRPLPPVLSGDGRLSLIPLTGHRDLVEMHHYSLRSVAAFVVKSDRGLPNRSQKEIDLHYWVERNFNSHENEAALALAVPLAAEMAAIMALPGVAALHEAAVAWHRARFDHLIGQAAGYRLWTACLHASGSLALERAREIQILRQYQTLAPEPGETA